MNLLELIETGKVIERLKEIIVDKLPRHYGSNHSKYINLFDDAAIDLLKELKDEVAD